MKLLSESENVVAESDWKNERSAQLIKKLLGLCNGQKCVK